MDVALAFLIEETGRIFTREVVIGKGRCLRITWFAADSLVQPVDGKERKESAPI